MATLNEPEQTFNDYILHEDLIIRKGIINLYGDMNISQMLNLSKLWSPWRGIVVWYLWKKFTPTK